MRWFVFNHLLGSFAVFLFFFAGESSGETPRAAEVGGSIPGHTCGVGGDGTGKTARSAHGRGFSLPVVQDVK